MNDILLTKANLPTVKQLAEQLPGGFVLYQENENRDILFVNQALLKIYECDTLDEFRELTGYSFHGMVHPDDLHRVQNSIDEQVNGEPGKDDYVEYRILTKNGTVKWLDDYGHFNKSEEFGELYYVFLVDVTERKLAQASEKRFFFDMSHEIITPLNAVRSALDLIKKHLDDPERLHKYLNVADHSLDELLELVDRLLEINRSQAVIAKPEETNDSKNASTSKKKKETARILIAEDNVMNQELLKIILEDAGFQSELAENGSQAVEMVRSHDPDYYTMVLMDIRMPVMDGYEATRQIRQLTGKGMEELPIYALSANSRDDDKAESFQAGMTGHLAKPYDVEQIVNVVHKYMK